MNTYLVFATGSQSRLSRTAYSTETEAPVRDRSGLPGLFPSRSPPSAQDTGVHPPQYVEMCARDCPREEVWQFLAALIPPTDVQELWRWAADDPDRGYLLSALKGRARTSGLALTIVA